MKFGSFTRTGVIGLMTLAVFWSTVCDAEARGRRKSRKSSGCCYTATSCGYSNGCASGGGCYSGCQTPGGDTRGHEMQYGDQGHRRSNEAEPQDRPPASDGNPSPSDVERPSAPADGEQPAKAPEPPGT